jgi:Zn-dependent protease
LHDFLRRLVLNLVPMILSLTVHEFAHALVATKLGDDTPEREERLTLSPTSHIDLFGTIFLPTMSILLAGQAFIGWAKPVPTNPNRYRRDVNMRTGFAIVSAAGPFSNLLLATISIALLSGLRRWGVLDPANSAHEAVMAFLSSMVVVNVSLFVFNLLPIPPLDGSRLLPRSLDGFVERLTPYSMLLFMALMMVPGLNELFLFWPIRTLVAALLAVFGGGGQLAS